MLQGFSLVIQMQKVIWNDSWMTIDEDLLQLNSIEIEEDFDADFYRPPKGPIVEGSRNSTMSVFAAKNS